MNMPTCYLDGDVVWGFMLTYPEEPESPFHVGI